MDCAHYQWGQDPDSTGPLGIDYIYLDNCTFNHQHFALFLLMVLWVAFLMKQMGTIAENYFSPTLGLVSEKLHVPFDVAGVTFLAFGNGAPDFFALLASVTGGADIMVSMGSLLGGEVFISTVVVGMIAMLCPCVLNKTILYRDLVFFIIAVTAVLILAIIQSVPLWLAVVYFVIYLSYVSIVLVSSWFGNGNDGGLSRSLINNMAGDIGLTRFDSESIQTAFWHRDAAGDQVAPVVAPTIPGPAGGRGKGTSAFGRPSTTHNQAQPSGGYSFLILSSDDDNEANMDPQRDIEGGTINISGGFEPNFDIIIREDFYSAESANSTSLAEPGRSLAATGYSVRDDNGGTDEESVSDVNSLEDRLLPSGTNDDMAGENGDRNTFRAQSRKIAENNPVLASLYWQQWALHRQFQKSAIATEWRTYPWYVKVLKVVEYPVVVLREFTIPTLDPTNWSKFHAVAHPVVDPLFVAYFLGFSQSSVEGIPVVVICLLISVVPAALIFLLTHTSRPPTAATFTFLWTIGAFCMCVVWIYILASELITCLSALGAILGIPSTFLGLTVLAWGNSLGDYVTNTSVAKQGLGEMALAGCYGGPVFNILGGMSVGLAIASYHTFPAPYPLKLDAACILSIAFLYISLISTMVIVTMNNYKVERSFGIYLLSLYAVYTICQMILLLFG